MEEINSEKKQFSNETSNADKSKNKFDAGKFKKNDKFEEFANSKQDNQKLNNEENNNQCDCDETSETNDQSCKCKDNIEEIERQRLQITKLESQVKEYLFSAQRLQADFDNFRKNAEIKIELAKTEGQIEAITKILPALDSFAGARKMIQDKTVLEGLIMIEKQLNTALQSLKVEKIEAIGKVFDPNLHNALAIIEDSSLEDNIIKEEYQSGYKLNDKVIRHSQVIVNKKEEK